MLTAVKIGDDGATQDCANFLESEAQELEITREMEKLRELAH
jgi:hypothetical protein